MRMKTTLPVIQWLVLVVSLNTMASPTVAQETKPVNRVLFTDVKVFDGVNEKRAEGMSVLVEGNKIPKIAKSISVPKGATILHAQTTFYQTWNV